MSNGMHHINHHQNGFTLLEVLITVIIMSIGILGLAGLQFNALRSNQNAAQSTIAALQLIDAADRLRGNLTGANNGDYDELPGGGEDPGCISTANGCTSGQLAQYDAWSWNNQITTLPGGEGVICLDSIPNTGVSRSEPACNGQLTNGLRMFAVKIWWDDDRNPITPKRRITMSITP